MKTTLIAVCCFFAVSCQNSGPNPDWMPVEDSATESEGGMKDGGHESDSNGRDAELGDSAVDQPDGSVVDSSVVECSDSLPCVQGICDPTSSTCVECLVESDCASAVSPFCSDQRKCVQCLVNADCPESAPVCGSSGSCGGCKDSPTACERFPSRSTCGSSGACVECSADTDCPLPNKARCDLSTNSCVPCNASGQCAHVVTAETSDLDVCTAGSCVQCTPATEAIECGAFACDPSTVTCTQTTRGTVATCGTCRADTECAPNHKCIQVPFGGVDSGFHCMRQATSGCGAQNPYRGTPITAPSKNGLAPAQYCAHNTNVTTCEAILALTSDVSCTPATVTADCGPGARCAAVNASSNRCSYSCSSDAVCPVDFPCNEQNGAEPNPYCGGPAI